MSGYVYVSVLVFGANSLWFEVNVYVYVYQLHNQYVYTTANAHTRTVKCKCKWGGRARPSFEFWNGASAGWSGEEETGLRVLGAARQKVPRDHLVDLCGPPREVRGVLGRVDGGVGFVRLPTVARGGSARALRRLRLSSV